MRMGRGADQKDPKDFSLKLMNTKFDTQTFSQI